MDFFEYESLAATTAVYPGQGSFAGVVYTALGVAGEAGEIAEKVKKAMRDDRGYITLERKLAIEKEMGDELWYLAMLARELKTDLNTVALGNLDKLKNRQENDTLHGDGDNR